MGGKKDKSEGLGRALMRQHNQMVRASKDKSRALHLDNRRAGNVLESVTDVSDIEAIVERATEAELLYSISNSLPDVPVDLDEASSSASGMTVEEWRRQQLREEAVHASSLRVPRRPPWNTRMTVEELDANERQAFIVWRRSLARLEENQRLVLTPFEKNLDIWRQLWRVLERSDLLVMVVDARDPLFYRCPDLEAYAREIDPHKKTLLLLNKADLLPPFVRQMWAEYFHRNGILFLFWSAKAASAALEGKKLRNDYQEVDLGQVSKVHDRDELLARLQAEAEAIVALRTDSSTHETESNSSDNGSVYVSRKRVVVGFVGYPNVGKSSTINALVGEKRTGVTSTPGKTKHFQTLIISDELMLCDCPGLVFPSFSSSRFDMIASGVLPIDRMTEHRGSVQVVANKVPRDILENIYNIKLPKPKSYESQSRPPLASELLRVYCASRGHVSSSGLPDETRAARQILKDYIDGRLPHYEMPPGTSETNAGEKLGIEIADPENDASDSCDSDDELPTDPSRSADAETPNLKNLIDDLDSFDLATVLSSKSTAVAKKSASTNKHHKKPQRKKDRSWRVGNDNADGMPVIRVFQKPAVNLGAIKTPI